MTTRAILIAAAAALALSPPLTAGMAGAAKAESQAQMIQQFAELAGQPASAERGHAFFLASHAGGHPDTPSCSTCHTKDPRNQGQTRAGKTIAPMAVSQSPDRFTDPKKVAKWFRRNCNTVLGRACTPGEKADIIAYFASL
ncbi:DUF1924 domain-containing protein [Acidimangrovimonas pyrenivorans]|uniref:DUF1924 domain-containing protein n=1 Tax=Acidimangrovimonas pyrenivorans TaxID=2030798 RepID=A0ABV7AJS9_9RHOB